MVGTVAAASRRSPFHGVLQIVRFNWPLYGAAAVITCTAPLVIRQLPMGTAARAALCAASVALLWIVGSLLASWVVYDRSPLMTGTWVPQALGFHPRSWLTIHAGFDEFTPALRLQFRAAGRALDIFDPLEMTESSIGRARRAAPLDTFERADFRRLPVRADSVEAVLLLLSAHELRAHAARRALLSEASRVLEANGRIIVAEHLRDWPNFLAFGPGFLHFHSARAWRTCFTEAGLMLYEEFSITPFVRVFVLRKPS